MSSACCPAPGAATAAFISYAEGRRSSPNREGFGKGEPDGIVSSEAANNAVTGGALVPTMALGIPGDAITAVMLATLTLHGITPGPKLVEDNPTLIATIFAGFFVTNLLLLPLGMLLSRVAAPILRGARSVHDDVDCHPLRGWHLFRARQPV